MSTQPSSTPSPGARLALRAWFFALIFFLVWMGSALLQEPPPDPSITGADADTARPGETSARDPGYVLHDLPPWGDVATPVPPFGKGEEYVLAGSGLQGFYQQTASGAAWHLSYSLPVLHAQLVKRGDSPEIVMDGVSLHWEMDPQTVLAQRGSAGKDESGAFAGRRGDMIPHPNAMAFSAPIPVTAVQSDGVLNPYPVVRVTATDSASGKVLARSAAVVGVAPGFGCAHCHADAGEAILEVHDRHQKTSLLEQARNGVPVACRSCHTGIDSEAGNLRAGAGLSVSAAVHGWHAPYLAGREADACLSCHIGLGRSAADGDAPARPLFARDLHIQRGLACVNCHGMLEDHALALLAAERDAGQKQAGIAMEKIRPRSVTELDAIVARLPWAQEPDCAACHDFSAKPGRETASAFNKWTGDASGLFSRSLDAMGMVRCISCHGAPHAAYPAANPVGRDRDNIVPLQYQEHARPLGAAGNCALCHMQSMDSSAHHPLVDRVKTRIHVPDKTELTLPPVSISHASHGHLACSVCHHTGYEDGKSLRCARSGCHDGIQPVETQGDDPDTRFFRTAFHGPGRSCFYCHSTGQKQGKPAGPVACKDCHTAPSPRWSEETAGRFGRDAVENAKAPGGTEHAAFKTYQEPE